jgi:hypothetical protein
MPRVVPSQVVELIDKLFPWAKDQREGDQKNYLTAANAYSISAVLDLLQHVPSELITLGPEDFAEFVSSVAVLRTLMQRWQIRDGQFTRIPGMRHLSPITLIRQALAKCKDEFPVSGGTHLNFISDNGLRERLRLDIGAVETTFANLEWKAATVLAGSVIEALLLWVLEKHFSNEVKSAVDRLVVKGVFGRPKGDPKYWDLYHYAEVAAELKAVEEDTVQLVRLARNYRNLIHPGKVERLGQACNRATAMTAISALDRVVEDLTKRFPVAAKAT